MKLVSWASKCALLIMFCKVLATNTQKDSIFGDEENVLDNVDAIENQPESPISDHFLDNSLEKHIPASNKQRGKIVELKKENDGKDLWNSGRISDNPACKKDFALLAHICRLPVEELRNNDFVALSCAQNRPLPKYEDAVSETCEAVMWKFKFDLTTDAEHGIAKRIQKRCHRDEETFQPCKKYLPQTEGKLSHVLNIPNVNKGSTGGGHYISCVFNIAFGLDDDNINKDETSEVSQPATLKLGCSQFLSDIESIVFSDYRLIGDFAEKCKSDIEGSNCGRISQKVHSDAKEILVQHSQGTVIECLSDHLDNLTKECKHETLRVVELQSQDYHLDRSLYFACKADREHFCAKEISGDGKIYTCLLKNKMKPKMSAECRKQLRRRQKIIAEDYKADYGLAKSCRTPIRKFHCKKQAERELEKIGEIDPKDVKRTRLSSILLCLEDAARDNEDALPPKCIAEMEAHRRQIMSDFQISPELVVKCAKDLQGPGECKNKGDGGRTIHCLMNLAYQGKLSSEPGCEDELRLLLKESNPLDSTDWRLDPVLQRACQDVVDQTCDPQGYKDDGTQSAVMGCLMHQLSISNNQYMNNECRAALMETQYFISRDFSLSPKLYKACKKDAQTICSSQSNWQKESKHPKSTYQPSTYVFPCLVRHLYKLDMEDKQEEENYGYGHVNDVLSEKCRDQLEKTLEERSVSVRLHPKLAGNCRQFLAKVCIEMSGLGEEMKCLEENIDELSKSEHQDCYESVVEHLRIQAKNPVLNPLLVSACGNVMRQHCTKEAVQREGSLLKCLITYKEEYSEHVNDELNACFGAIEHWQILSLKDIRFSFNFKQACRSDILTHCNTVRKLSKLKVVACLSDIIVSDAMNKAAAVAEDTDPKSNGPTISDKCQKEVKFQLLQKHSNLKLNSIVKEACDNELREHCSIPSLEEGNHSNSLECLKSLEHSKLGESCREVLFIEEKEEAVMNSVDYALLKLCKHEIKNYNCEFQGKGKVNGVFRCLKDHRHEPTFDKMCLKILDERIRERSHDYRLNPTFQAACARNIKHNCSDILNHGHDKHAEADFLEGQVIACLQQVYLKNEKDLYPECKRELTSIIQRSALDYKASPSVLKECKRSIEVCKKHTGDFDGSQDDFEDGGIIEECLRMLFKSNKLAPSDKKCSKVIAQRIQVSEIDMMIDPILQDACSLDLVKFCRNVPAKEGKRLQCLFYILREQQPSAGKDTLVHPKDMDSSRLGIDTLRNECVDVLKDRSEMFKLAVRQAPISADAIRNVNDLYNQISSSPHRNYLLIVSCSLLFVIFIGGLLCGRVSKRARVEYVQKIR